MKYISHHQKLPAPTPMRKDILNCNSVIPGLGKYSIHVAKKTDFWSTVLLKVGAVLSMCNVHSLQTNLRREVVAMLLSSFIHTGLWMKVVSAYDVCNACGNSCN